ncbi:coiled-coil domain-containing protein 88B [Trichosurus vulpecula]|uniref:coiled-coil domain-containing protein 88B n=1 Tax=Trichosurus vulpecula TaxID=9337 RepID=UPI00186B2E32|nr:coiled-coil domain-containing protein 88B [Trichosurus vulpecula]
MVYPDAGSEGVTLLPRRECSQEKVGADSAESSLQHSASFCITDSPSWPVSHRKPKASPAGGRCSRGRALNVWDPGDGWGRGAQAQGLPEWEPGHLGEVQGLAGLVGEGQEEEDGEEEEEEPLSSEDRFLRLSDGALLHRVMGLIAPSSRGGFLPGAVQRGLGARRVRRLSHLQARLRDFYQEELQLLILVPPPDLQMLGFEPLSEEAIEELEGTLKLMLGASVQCEHRELFIRHIQGLSLEVQSELAAAIQEVSQPGAGMVLALAGPEPGELDGPELELLVRSHTEALVRLARERDRAAQRLAEVLQEQEVLSLQPETPQRVSQEGPHHHLTLQLADAKAQLRRLRQELEEKAEELLDSQGEVQGLEAEIRRLRQEAQVLLGQARRATLYREEAEMLRERAGRLPRLQEELRRCRERLHVAEAYKGQLEEERALSGALEAARALLEEQLEAARARCSRLHETQRENLLLRARLGEAQVELESTRQQLDQLVEENVELEAELRRTLQPSPSSPGDAPQPCWTPSLQDEVREVEMGHLRSLERENQELRGQLRELKAGRWSQPPLTEVEDEELEIPKLEVPNRVLESSGLQDIPKMKIEPPPELHSLGDGHGKSVPVSEGSVFECSRPSDSPETCPDASGEAEKPVPSQHLDALALTQQQLEGKVVQEDLQGKRLEGEISLQGEMEAGGLERKALNAEHKPLERKCEGQPGGQPPSPRLEVVERDEQHGETESLVQEQRLGCEVQDEKELVQEGKRGKAEDWEREQQALRGEIEILKRAMEALEKERESLKGEVEAGEQRLKALNGEHEALRGEQEVQGQRLEALERELESLQQERETLRGELEAQGRRLEARGEEAARLGEELAQARRAEAEAHSEAEAEARERDGLREALEAAGRELEAAGQEREALAEALGAAGRERRQWEREGARLRGRAEAAEQKLLELESEGRALRDQAEKERQVVEAMREELQGAAVLSQQLKTEVGRLQLELEWATQDRDKQLKEQEKCRERTYQALEKRLEEESWVALAAKDEEMAALKARVRDLEQQLQCQASLGLRAEEPPRPGGAKEAPIAAEAIQETLSGRLIMVERSNAALTAEKAALQGQLRQLEGQVGALQGRVQELQLQNHRAQEHSSQLQAEKAVLETQARELRERLGALDKEMRGARQEQEAAWVQHQALLRDHEALGRLQQRQEVELEGLLGRHRELKATLRELELSHKELQGRYEQLQAQRAQVEAQEVTLQAERERLAQERLHQKGLEEELRRLQSDHERAQVSLADATRERGELQGERGELRGRLARLELERAQLEAQGQGLREANQRLDLSVCRLTTQCQLLTELRAAQEEENRQLLAEVQALSRENRGLMERSLESRDHLHREQREYLDQLNALRREKQKLVEKIMDQYRVLEPGPLPRTKKGSWLADKVKKLMRHKREGGLLGGPRPGAEGAGSTESLGSPLDIEPPEGKEASEAASPGPMRRAQSSLCLRDDTSSGGQRRRLSSRLPVVRGSASFSPGDSPRQRFRQRRPGPLGAPSSGTRGWDGSDDILEGPEAAADQEGETGLGAAGPSEHEPKKAPLTPSLSQ